MSKSRYNPSSPRSYPLDKEPSLREILSRRNSEAWIFSKKAQTGAIASDAWLDHHPETISLDVKQRWLRRLLAYGVLLPVGIIAFGSLLKELLEASMSSSLWFSLPVWYSLVGILIWVVLHFSHLFDNIFLYIYVLGHELTHFLAIIVSGGKVSQFRVSVEGGFVETNKNSVFIALSPYFLPLWCLVWLGLCALVALFVPWTSFAGVAFAGVGFWWSFHFYWTLWVIPKDQPDLNENGTTFSLMIIYLANLFFTVIGLSLFGALSLSAFLATFWRHIEIAWLIVRDICLG